MKMGVAVGFAAFALLAPSVFSLLLPGLTPERALRFFRFQAGFLNPAPEMVEIPAGSFMMGASESVEGSNEWPPHVVNMPAFAISKHEVTFNDWHLCALYKGCLGRADNQYVERGDLPLKRVSWDDAKT